MLGDSLCGYYAILSKLYYLYSGNTQVYLELLKLNWKPNYSGETWDNYMNGWLPPEGIQVIANYIKQIIILIYLENGAVQIFFPNMFDSFLLEKMNYNLTLLNKYLKQKKLMWKCLKKSLIMIA
jgi:hypothetical protein